MHLDPNTTVLLWQLHHSEEQRRRLRRHPRPAAAPSTGRLGGTSPRAVTPDLLADAIARAISTPANYEPVHGDGAARAATALAELL